MSTSLPFFPLLIVGAGPTGLALANLLGSYGLDTLLIERGTEACTFPRAIALDDEGLRVCQALGLNAEVQAQLLSNLEAHYLSGSRLLSRVSPIARRYGFPLISTFHQPTFEATLLAGLQRFPTITTRFGHSLETFSQEGDHVLVSVRDHAGEVYRVACAYLLACDGARSTVRRTLKLPMRGTTYAQRWLVIDSLDDPDRSTEVRFFCNPARPAVTVPAPGQRRRWEFMLRPGEHAEDLLAPERMQALIHQVGGPAAPHITRAAVYTFHAAVAASFQQGRVFLLGDAAHLMPPFGGQGMNCGLRDAHNLAWKLWMTLRGAAAAALLTTYTRERLEHTRHLVGFSRFLGTVIMPTARSIAIVRDAIFAVVNTLPALRTYLSQADIKPEPRYRQGFFWQDSSRTNRRLAGRMLPQPEITTHEVTGSLLDDQLGAGFTLLYLGKNGEQMSTDLTRQAAWESLDASLLNGGDEVRAALALSPRDDLGVLVRPDRYIYGACAPERLADLVLACEKDLRDTSV